MTNQENKKMNGTPARFAEKECKMKIILTYPDLGEEAERCIIEWINNIVADKDPESMSPLRYVDEVEVIK